MKLLPMILYMAIEENAQRSWAPADTSAVLRVDRINTFPVSLVKSILYVFTVIKVGDYLKFPEEKRSVFCVL